MSQSTDLLLKLQSRVEKRADGCWIWLGSKRNKYGSIGTPGRRTAYVHRVVFELVNNVKLQPKQVVMHRCDVPLCINPDHLRAGTQRDNLIDAILKGRQWEAAKLFCKRGHPLTGVNLRVQARRNGSNKRVCRICNRMHQKIYKRSKRWAQT